MGNSISRANPKASYQPLSSSASPIDSSSVSDTFDAKSGETAGSQTSTASVPVSAPGEVHIPVQSGADGYQALSDGSEGDDTKTQDTPHFLRYWENPTDALGGVATLLAMIPQGLFGMLLMDKHVFDSNYTGSEDVDIAIRASLDFLLFVAAVEGKRCIVRMYNTPDFKVLPKTIASNLKAVKDMVTFQHRYQWKDIAALSDKVHTLLISGLFAGLAHISFMDTADLLDDLGAPSVMGSLAKNTYFQAPFIASALLCNLIAFPNIHKYGIEAFTGSMQYLYKLIFDRARLKKEQNIAMQIENVRLAHEQDIEGSREKISTDLRELNEKSIFGLDQKDQEAVLSLDEATLAGVFSAEKTNNLTSTQQALTHFAKLAGVAVGIMGLYNFADMAELTLGKWPIVDKTVSATKWMCFSSMIWMTMSSIPPFVEKTMNAVFGVYKPIPVLSSCKEKSLVVLSLLMAALGGTPNAYQAELAGENTAMLVLAAVASFLIEMPGLLSVWVGGAEDKVCKADQKLGAASHLDQRLAWLRDHATVEETSVGSGLSPNHATVQ